MISKLGGWAGKAARGIGWFLLPLLAAVYPVIFHYANNSGILSLPSLYRQLPLLLAVALGVCLVCLAALRGRPVAAANASFVFLLFFQTYGLLFGGLQQWDRIRIEHYTLLPALILAGAYAAGWVGRMDGERAVRLWQGLTLVAVSLVAFNLAKIVPEELEKARIRNQPAEFAEPQGAAEEGYPDIYYIVLDEMAGFDAVRGYWHYDAIDSFEAFLSERGFYIAQASHSATTCTFYELASRMNYREYPFEINAPTKYWGEYLASIGNNRTMQYLKSLGYQTVVFDELPVGFLPFEADVVYAGAPASMLSWGSIFDDFGMLVLGNTMVEPFLGLVKANDPAVASHIRNLHFTMENITQEEVPSPKFIYVHLLIPHVPFMYDADGGIVATENHENWDYYFGQYLYTVQLAQTMIDRILQAERTPGGTVIIFQSDHGARNMMFREDTVILRDYPEAYKTLIVNALRLPGCAESGLTQDMDPINTFPILFNCYFNADIPLH